jgi:O-antigen/teichoic acid export membrane protein
MLHTKLATKEQALTERHRENDFFDTTHLKADLKGQSIRSGTATMFGQVIKFLIRMASVALLARLLKPGDFGLVAMVTVVTEFILMFKDMGLSTATIQRDEVNHDQISTLFWINTGIGLALAMLTVTLAPAIAWFYHEPRLRPVTVALAMGFVFGGLTIQHEALLKRNMRFAAVATIEVTSMATGVTTAIVAACFGARYWSLVCMQVATSATMAIQVWIASGWRPGWPRLHSGIRSMLSFGWNIVGFRLVNYFARNVDGILLGRFWGAGVLGLYNRAHSILMLPLSNITWPMTSVAMPALSRIQDDPRRYASYYTKAVQFLSFICMPLIVLLAVCSKSVINIMLGSQWTGASRIFQILAITAFIQPVSSTTAVVLLSLGLSGRLLKFGIFNSLFIVLSFAIGIRWGAIGVAAAYAVANYGILFPSLWYCFRKTPITISAFMRAIARPTIATLMMALVLLLANLLLGNQPDIAVVGLSLVVGLPVYLGMWALMPGGMQILRDLSGYITLILIKKPFEA